MALIEMEKAEDIPLHMFPYFLQLPIKLVVVFTKNFDLFDLHFFVAVVQSQCVIWVVQKDRCCRENGPLRFSIKK